MMSRLDHIYRSLLLTKFFTKGWGNPENLKQLFEFRKVISCREKCKDLVSADYPVHIDLDETQKECRIIEGHFISPFTKHLPGIMPKEIEMARFQMILPKVWPNPGRKPVCIHLAGTGDHYFWRRRTLLARPLLKEAGIASILLENPYYGVRKPKHQLRSSLHNVSDLFVMGGGLVLESLVLFHWCERQGFGPLGISGISMGGHMASLAATNWHKPVSLIPILSWSTASTVFTEGVMSEAIPWQLLQEQYHANSSYEVEVAKLVHSPENNYKNVAFRLGQTFARNYPGSVSDMEAFQKEFFLKSHETADRRDECSGTQSTQKNNTSSSVTIKSPGAAHYHTEAPDSSTRHPEPKPNNTRNKSWWKTFNLLSRSNALPYDTALHFMRGVMDECTHVGNFSKPVDTSLVIVVVAKSDAYVPRDSVLSIEDLWPGAEVRYIDTGHIAAYLFKQAVFRRAIIDAFQRQIDKYYH
jgi:hypothetical protein